MAANQIFTSVIVAGELRYGAFKKASAPLRQRIDAVLDAITILALDAKYTKIYGKLRAELEANGQSIGANDLWIGTHAMVLQMTLVTGNVREFSRVNDLQIENWRE